MKKFVTMITCIVLAMIMCVGCGNSKSNTTDSSKTKTEPKTESSDKKSSDPVTITYACWDSAQAKLIRKMADEFEAKNKDIKIKIQVTGWDDYWTSLEAAGTGGSLPDTFWMHSNNIYYYGSNDQLLDLTDYINKSKEVDLKNYPEGLNKIYNIDGRQYAIPKDYDTIGLWYNKKLFKKNGIKFPDENWTWKDLYAAAKKLTTGDKKQYGICAGLHNQEGYYNFVYQNGGKIITDDKKSGYADPKTVEGIKFYFDFVKDGLSPAIYDDKGRSEAIENGLCAMGLFGSWNLSSYAANKTMAKDWDVAVLPKSNNGGQASIFNGLGNAIAKTCKHPDEAWRWIEYLSSKEGQTRQAELGIAISAYNGTADAFVKAYPMFNAKAYIEMVKYAQIRPYSNQTSVWEDKSYELLKGAYGGKEDLNTACKKTAKMMDEAIAVENK